MKPIQAALLISWIVLLSALGAHAQGIRAATRVFLPIANNSDTHSAPPTATPTVSPLAKRLQVIQLVNEYRAANGCPTASENPILMDAAQEWSDYMQEHRVFEHSAVEDPQWYKHRGYIPGASENIATGQDTAQQVVHDWQVSPNHNRTLLSCYYASQGYVYDIGIGLNGRLWTLALGERLP